MLNVLKEIPKKWRVIGAVLALLLVVGFVNLVGEVASLLHIHLPSISLNNQKVQQGTLTVVKDASKASFTFWVPAASPDWTFDPKSPVFDASRGVVDYQMKLTGGTIVTISQQVMPDELKPWDTSAKFNQFISQSNVTMSEPAGKGKAYFRTTLTNGVPANGADTVIYANDDILMFGQAGEILSYDKWAKLLAAMMPVSKAQ
ncbi:MAG TPA: hypothetical protein VGH44_02210 [Candidatus Saccharimonadia bacterium]